MTLLDNHLEQIALSSAAIGELPFPPPKIFTNAILHSHDITNLIRDTESHERALFTLAAAEEKSRSLNPNAARRKTVQGPNGTVDSFRDHNGLSHNYGQRSAVAMILGGEFAERFRKPGAKDSGERSEVDVNALLDGAERLCAVYPIPGAPEKIASLRSRHGQLQSSVAHYEARESKQMAQLTRMNKQRDGGIEYDDTEEDEAESGMEVEAPPETPPTTEEDLKKEEEEIRMLEEKKRALEDRVSGMEKDLGGLLR